MGCGAWANMPRHYAPSRYGRCRFHRVELRPLLGRTAPRGPCGRLRRPHLRRQPTQPVRHRGQDRLRPGGHLRPDAAEKALRGEEIDTDRPLRRRVAQLAGRAQPRACSSGPTSSGPRPCSRRPARPASARFHHVSTCEVYGDLPLDADEAFHEDSPYRPRTPYNASKAGADHAVRAYAETYGLPITITNCANNYGPYQFPEKLIPHFCALALDDQALTLVRQHGEPPRVAARLRPLHGDRRRAGPGAGGGDVPRRQRRGGVHHGGGGPHSGRAGQAGVAQDDRPGPTRSRPALRARLPRSCVASWAGRRRWNGTRGWRTPWRGTRPTGTGGSRCAARAPVAEGSWGTGVPVPGSQLSDAHPDHRGGRAAGPRPARLPGRAACPTEAAAVPCWARRVPGRACSTRCWPPTSTPCGSTTATPS